MLSTINWTNRSDFAGATDNRFDDVFGTLQTQAIGVVDAAISYWARTINNFNYNDGTNTYNVSISMNAAASNTGANAFNFGFTGTKPSSATVGIGWVSQAVNGNVASGWWVDPTPFESSEFPTETNGFSSLPTVNLGGADLFTVVAHELGHAMGLFAGTQLNALGSDTNLTDMLDAPASTPVSSYWQVNAAGQSALWTEWDSGGATGSANNAGGMQHFAPAGAQWPAVNPTNFGATALMNASSASRCIISNVEAAMLQSAYAYTITLPTTFGTMYNRLNANGQLLIDMPDGVSNDEISISSTASLVSVTMRLGTPVRGIDPVGFFTSTYDASSVTSIRINAGDGADIITLGPLGGIPVAVLGDGGNDSLIINGATGNNTLDGDDFTGGSHNVTQITSVESLTLNGTGGNENFSINNRQFFDSVTSLVINGGDGGDTCTIGQGELDRATQAITNFVFNGQSGNDNLTLNNSTELIGNWNYGVTNTYVEAIAAGYYFAANYTSCNSLTVHGTPQTDTFVVPATLSPTAQLNGNDGSDNVILGGGNLTGVQPQVFNGGNGVDQITFDNHLDATNRIWDMRNNEVIFGGLISLGTTGFESVGVLGGSGQDEFDFKGVLGQGFNVDGGLNTDTFVLGYQGSVYFNNSVTLQGGDGGDVFTINDAAVSAFTTLSMDGGDFFNTMNVNEPLATGFYIGPGYFIPRTGASNQGTFGFANMTTTIYTGTASDNDFTIYSAGISVGTVTINGGSGNDSFLLAPQASGYTFQHLTINGQPGTDTFTYDASALLTDQSYTVGTNTLTIARGGVSFDIVTTSSMDSVTLNTGSGNDSATIEQYLTTIPLTINGGEGNDSIDICPVSKNLTANIATGNSMNFNGGNGSDYLGVHNDSNNNAHSYIVDGTSLVISNQIGSTTFNGFFYYSLVEHTSMTGGPKLDGMSIYNSVLGTTYDLNGGPGAINDYYAVGYVLSPSLVSGIHGAVNVDGSGGGVDTVDIFNSSETAARTLHIGNNLVGAAPGDNLFGAGGYLHYVGIAGTMTVRLGSGADTVYAAPDVLTPITITAANPSTAPGDTLNLALATAQGFVINGTPANGNVTSTNLKTLSYTGFESGPNVDTAAPYIVAQNYDVTGVPTIRIQFSENVSNSLTTSYLELINTTTLAQVPVANLALAYDAGTNTASFTFPGYADGVLPPGEYTAKIYASLTDLFGNAMGVETPFSFTAVTPPPASISFTGAYSQNFDTLPTSGTTLAWANNSTLSGWSLYRQPAAGTAITTINAGTGSSTTGSFYSFGVLGSGLLTDRALGGLGSGAAYFGSPVAGTVAGWFAIGMTNDTGAPINKMSLGYDGEQWRDGGNTSTQVMKLEYGFGNSFTTVPTLTAPGGSFDFTSPIHTAAAATLDGNAAGNRTAGLGGTLNNLGWTAGSTLWVRWVESNDAGNDHALAIDNVQFSLPAAFFGDFNADGSINAADFVVWRKTLGTNGIPAYSGADGDGDGTIDQDDYGVLRVHYGKILPPGAASGMGSVAAGTSNADGQSEINTSFASQAEPLARDVQQGAGTREHAVGESLETMNPAPVVHISRPVFDVVGERTAPRPGIRRAAILDSRVSANRHDAALLTWLSSKWNHDSPIRDAEDDKAQDKLDSRDSVFELFNDAFAELGYDVTRADLLTPGASE